MLPTIKAHGKLRKLQHICKFRDESYLYATLIPSVHEKPQKCPDGLDFGVKCMFLGSVGT